MNLILLFEDRDFKDFAIWEFVTFEDQQVRRKRNAY